VVGGDGTMSFAQKFIERGATKIVGVPKTIDNDLEATEMTIGFATAVEVVVEALERLHTTAESHERIMIVEVMGRYAGWIALTSALSGGAHVCLIARDRVRRRSGGRAVPPPPRPRRVVLDRRGRRGREAQGRRYAVAVKGDATKQDKLGGAGQRLAEVITARTEYEVRCTVLGHIQRGGAPCAFDRELGTRFGVKAVDLIARGQFGHVAALEHGSWSPSRSPRRSRS
jgi:6-phosphofructokinase